MITYKGSRINGLAVVWWHDPVPNTGEGLDARPSMRVRNHSPTGFEWGYSGSGPAQLALALLLHALQNRERAEKWYQRFKAEHVAGWGDEWEITEGRIIGIVQVMEAKERGCS